MVFFMLKLSLFCCENFTWSLIKAPKPFFVTVLMNIWYYLLLFPVNFTDDINSSTCAFNRFTTILSSVKTPSITLLSIQFLTNDVIFFSAVLMILLSSTSSIIFVTRMFIFLVSLTLLLVLVLLLLELVLTLLLLLLDSYLCYPYPAYTLG